MATRGATEVVFGDPSSKIIYNITMYYHAKFHTFIIKSTIIMQIFPNIYEVRVRGMHAYLFHLLAMISVTLGQEITANHFFLFPEYNC